MSLATLCHYIRYALCALPIWFIPTQASAEQSSDYIETNNWVLATSIGFGKAQTSQTDREDLPLYIVPDIRYYGKTVTLQNTSIGFAFKQTPSYQLELIGRQNYDGLSFYGSGRALQASFRFNSKFDPPIEIEPRRRSMSYLAGLGFSAFFEESLVELDVAKDISNVHHGYETRLTYSRYYSWDNWHFMSKLRVAHKSDNLIDYYYGPEKNNIELHGSNISYKFEVQLSRELNDSLWIVSAYSAELLSTAARSSTYSKDAPLITYFIGFKWFYKP
ncbi:MipA/OmpV family protein [Pseudoalteromonas piscicida]|uniref:MipA/OmpV family protein n=1 Tax=Pseudoalteromonas piscicida TaxID=43662 RepID=UPI0030A1B3D1